MKLKQGFILVALLTALAVPAVVQAQCAINELGILHIDTDCDGIIDRTSDDDDNHDGIPDGEQVDNCPAAPNGDCSKDPLNCDVNQDGKTVSAELATGYQLDWNHNDVGDACDDTDKDGVIDYLDNCKSISNPLQNTSACTDTDHDGFEDAIDNCINDYNPDQQDTDHDGVGDACDNCRFTPNPAQLTTDCSESENAGGSMTVTGNPGGGPNPNQTTPPPEADENVIDNGETLKGNGFGDGGCQLNPGSQNASVSALVLFTLAAAVLAVSSRRKG